jgi:hypothetical protein
MDSKEILPELYRAAARVVATYYDKQAPRHREVEAMHALRELIAAIGESSRP